MPQNWRRKFVEENNDPAGSNPECGAIFMSNSATRKECLRRGLFGLPTSQAAFVKQVKAGMLLFLFEFESRQLHGVFQACSDGAMNIVPSAFCSSGKQFPAQVKFIEMWQCRPLCESEFRDAIRENYFSAKKFNFGLSEVQVKRLLMLFSFKKLERLPSTRTEVVKPRRQPSNDFNRGTGDHISPSGSAVERYGDIDSKLDVRVMSPRDSFASGRNHVEDSRLTATPSLHNETEIDQEFDTATRNEYPGDTSGDFRRVLNHSLLGLRDRIGNEFSMDTSFKTDASTMSSDYSLSNIRRFPENLRCTPSDRLENEYPNNDGFAQGVSTGYPSSLSNLNLSANHSRGPIEAETLVFDLPRLPLKPLYTTNTENYNPSYLSLQGDTTIASATAYGPDASNVDSMRSSFSAANGNFVLREGITSCGGYVNDTAPLEKVQPFPNPKEQMGTSNHMDANLGWGDYVPLPSNLHEYTTRASMTGVAFSENARNYETPSYPSGCSVYPFFIHPLSLRDGVGSSSQDRVNNEIPAHQRKEEFGGDASDFNNKCGWIQDHVSHAERESQKIRRSVFTRLVLPPKECDAERDTSNADESVDEVMASLQECRKDWMKQQKYRSNTNHSDAAGKFKTKRQKSHSSELLEDNSSSPTETSPNDLMACEESMEPTVKEQPFIDFRRRSETRKSHGGLARDWKDSPEDPAPRQNKKRKLIRPKLSKEEPSKEKGTSDNPVENDTASYLQTSVGKNKVGSCKDLVMSSTDRDSKSCPSEDGNTNGHEEEMPKHEEPSKEKGTSNTPVGNDTASYSVTSAAENKVGASEVPVISSADMESKSCPDQDGNTNACDEEMSKFEEAKEDAYSRLEGEMHSVTF